METIKDYIIRALKKRGLPEGVINAVLQLSEERILWLKDVAWNLARNTGEYDRFVLGKELSPVEEMIEARFEAEETEKWCKEMERDRQEWWCEYEKKQASAYLNYIFPIGEA